MSNREHKIETLKALAAGKISVNELRDDERESFSYDMHNKVAGYRCNETGEIFTEKQLDALAERRARRDQMVYVLPDNGR